MATTERGEEDTIRCNKSPRSRRFLQEGRGVQASGTGEQQIILFPEPEAKVMWENKPFTPQGVTVVHRIAEDSRISFKKKEERQFLKRRTRYLKVH